MSNNRMESLKKRTKTDMICSFVVSALAIGIAIKEFYTYGSNAGGYPVHLMNGIYSIFAFGVTLILGLILLEVHKIGKPFSKRIINELRVLAITVIIGGILPDIFAPIIADIVNGTSTEINIYVLLNVKNVIISIIGVAIGILSEIFVYGYELQDDIDSIA